LKGRETIKVRQEQSGGEEALGRELYEKLGEEEPLRGQQVPMN